MEVGVLVDAGRIARIGVVIVGTLEVCVVTLGAGEGGRGRGRGHCRGTGLGSVRSVVGVSWRAVRLVTVMAWAELLCLDVRPLLAGFAGGRRRRGRALVSPDLSGSTAAAVG